MFQDIRAAVRMKVILVLILVHLGLALAVAAMAGAFHPAVEWDQNSSLLLAGVLCLYGGFLLGVFFILRPLLKWQRRSRQVEFWTEAIARNLPVVLENLPKILAVIRQVRSAWEEATRATVPEPAPAPAPAGKPS